MRGGVLSILTVAETDAERPTPFVARHVNVAPAVSAVSVVGVQPEEDAIPDSGSVTFQLTPTLLVYQPLLPNVPVICGTMTGGVVSPPPWTTTVPASAAGDLLSTFPTKSRATL